MMVSSLPFAFATLLVNATGQNPPAAPVSQLEDRAIRAALVADSETWPFNRLDRNSLSSVRFVRSSQQGPVYRVHYTFNRGTPGWMEATFQQGRVHCVAFHDAPSCRPPQAQAQYTPVASASVRGHVAAALPTLMSPQASIDPGSLSEPVLESTANGLRKYRFSYTWNRGRPGAASALIDANNRVRCITFASSSNCREILTTAQVAARKQENQAYAARMAAEAEASNWVADVSGSRKCLRRIRGELNLGEARMAYDDFSKSMRSRIDTSSNSHGLENKCSHAVSYKDSDGVVSIKPGATVMWVCSSEMRENAFGVRAQYSTGCRRSSGFK
ncbi:hypothetical protein [Sphingomonas sp.]|uniref:hypothetical protein n=1 Tax=Sphingomonas sp. TaxID=28214 RepID=UPI002DD66DBB|nr:hypothetical protein [Sphingomonas sp.]